MSNKQIEKHLELPHQETIVGTNTLQTKQFDNQKIEKMSNKQSMKTPIENLIAWLKLNHPDAVPSQTEIDRWVMAEKIDLQMSYNAGFANAKRIYQMDGIEL